MYMHTGASQKQQVQNWTDQSNPFFWSNKESCQNKLSLDPDQIMKHFKLKEVGKFKK